jgi:hypothetical protein
MALVLPLVLHPTIPTDVVVFRRREVITVNFPCALPQVWTAWVVEEDECLAVGLQEDQTLTGSLEEGQVLSVQKCGRLPPSHLILAFRRQMDEISSKNLER